MKITDTKLNNTSIAKQQHQQNSIHDVNRLLEKSIVCNKKNVCSRKTNAGLTSTA